MERELWRVIRAGLRRLPPTRPRNAVYTDTEILAVLLWAAIHDRPVSWACRRSNWPPQAWRRNLPDQSTMSRRLREPCLRLALKDLLGILQMGLPVGEILVVDGKPLELSEHTRDPDARTGRGAGRYAKGYKLHAIADPRSGVILMWRVLPLNAAEPTAAAAMLRENQGLNAGGKLLLGDASYDSNPLHAAAAERGLRLIAPRKNPGTRILRRSGRRAQHPNRLASVSVTEGPGRSEWETHLGPRRAEIERFFGAWASFGGGLATLPPWVRREHRVHAWVGAKAVINGARIKRRSAFAA